MSISGARIYVLFDQLPECKVYIQALSLSHVSSTAKAM